MHANCSLRSLHAARPCKAAACLTASRNSVRARAEPQRERQDAMRRLQVPQAPPPGSSSPPPPPPPEGPTGNDDPFPRRRDILAALLVGSGLWWWRLKDLRPDVRIRKTAKGNPYMVTGTGEVFALFQVPRLEGQEPYMVMVDLNGNMYFDPNDKSQGMYIVDQQRNVINAYMTPDNELAIEKVGRLDDMRPIKISSIGSVKLDGDGAVVWAFVDSTPLVLDPESFLQTDKDGNKIVAYPQRVDEGVIALTEARKGGGLFNLFGRKDGDFGGPLQRGTP